MHPALTAFLALAATLGLSASFAAAAKPRSAEEVFLDGSYGATLHTRTQRWQLLDDDGAVTLLTFENCGPRVELPPGLWLLTRDVAGDHKLIAPSVTPLPNHHAGEVAIAACGEPARANTLQLPAALIAALDSHASSILIQP
ncbi:MAG: hypothetical protein H4O13_03685 [Xanthomonadales bacterium]|nr:hypothetical protein [Xanthomonadales bacterium]